MGRPKKVWHNIGTNARPDKPDKERMTYDPIVILYEYDDEVRIAKDIRYGKLDDFDDEWTSVLAVNGDIVDPDCKPRHFVNIKKDQFYAVEDDGDSMFISLFPTTIKWAYESDYDKWIIEKSKEEN